MLDFILTIILMFAAGTVLYLFVRTLPRLAPDPEEKKSFLERWVTSEFPEKIDAAFNGFAVKFLRKVKLYILKIDNFVGERLRRFKPENGNGKNKDFSEIQNGKNNGEGMF